ncbi:MAG TPA: hypothetical protein VMF69_09020 [Gemmataceae bacterium]|nr:hypothetical protein [Gemmataceae bacterium]
MTPSLDVDFGNLAPGQTGDADFLLVSQLQGIFTSFTASYTHSDALGGQDTSLIQSVQTHTLIHAGDFDFPGSTGEMDYLAEDTPNADNLPDTIWFSNGTTAPVNIATNVSSAPASAPNSYTVTANVTSGWDYIQLQDPGAGYTLSSVVRSDGTVIPVSDQAWTTDRTFDAAGESTVDDELHILDFDSTGSYTVTYVSITQTPPTSTVAALPAFSSGSFNVSWSGQASTGGNNIASYDVYVSDNGGAFTPWLTDTTQNTATFTGVKGHTYGFYSIATDNAGNIQSTPPGAQASTKVDTVAPTSSVSALPAFSPASFTVSWSGTDNAGGSGIASYSIFASDDGGPFTPLLTDTTQTSTTFMGVNGHTYGFYIVATDNVGNVQPTPTAAQATTAVTTLSVASTPALSALQGETTGSVLLATFTQGAATQLAGAYTATVVWGDGSSDTSTEANSPISIQVSGQTISVYGTHTYTTSGMQYLSVTVSTTGTSATAYPTVTVSPNVSSQISSSSSGLVYNRSTGLFGGSVTLSNTGTTALNGELMIVFTGLPGGVTLANSTGIDANGDPYILVNLTTPLLPGQSVAFNVFFRNPSKALFNYGLTTFDSTNT